ncbi:MAG: uroporphyrinogen-III C-methyltransferase [Acidobacteria bacterium]|nr:MAG: uroporphyrinogen-III C-methyltransferase [Acidobacteriota bacterium]
MPVGRVYLVGAGPGDPELITVRGRRCLERAEVVVYDRLVHPELLAAAPAGAERIFVGKAAGMHVASQAEINQLLVWHARRGRVVVRLKGGDPFVFGRGGEEAEALSRAGIPWQVVPAVSSAAGVPARASIPLTHRGVAASFAVITAHRAGDAGQEPDWQALARIDTLVILMGVAGLPHVARALIDAGRDPDTPVAVIERGTLPDERVICAPLRDVAERARQAGVRPPATIVVGEVVALRRTLAQLPLAAAAAPPAWTAPLAASPQQPHDPNPGGLAHVR